MAKLSYPTRTLLEDFLMVVYPNPNICLSNSLNILGYTMEQFDTSTQQQYGTIPVQVNTLTGIDIPVLVENGNTNKGTIAIVAQDPLRSDKDAMLNGLNCHQPIIGTPFALHYKENVYPQTEVYRKIIQGLLHNGYKVYITDAHKIYQKGKSMKTKSKEIPLLEKEMDQIRPSIVVTFGNKAREYIMAIKNSYTVLSLLHPSQTNWDHWKQWIFEQAYNNKKTYNVDWGKYAKVLTCKQSMFDKTKDKMPDLIAEITEEMVKSSSNMP